MPRNYVDNAMNRNLGRVGMPVGSMVQSRSSISSGLSSLLMTSGSSVPSSQSQTRTYVDNAYNRSHDRVGLEVGSKVIPAPTTQRQSTSTYVDNSYNRQHGRVGLEKGSKVISKDIFGNQPHLTKTYVDNSYNRQHGRVGLEKGSKVISKDNFGNEPHLRKTSVANSYNRQHGRVGLEKGSKVIPKDNFGNEPHLSKTYVDNSYNRQHGRVGLEKGSKVISKDNFGNEPHLRKTYVDNSYNRQHGRVGLEKGSKVIPKDNFGNEPHLSKTYVDNSYNRQHDRVGLEKGSKVISKDNFGNEPHLRKTYVDNWYNRQHGRVGLEKGSRPISSKKSNPNKQKPALYADTPLNRRLGRVGKIVGTNIGSSGERKVYADNPLNRKLGRVGEPLGSRPHSKKSKETKDIKAKADETIKRQTEYSYDSDDWQIYRPNDDYPPDMGYSNMRQFDVKERSYDDFLPSMGQSDEYSCNADYVYSRMLKESEWTDDEYPPKTRPSMGQSDEYSCNADYVYSRMLKESEWTDDEYPPKTRPSMGQSDEYSCNADYVYSRMLKESEWTDDEYPPKTRPNELKAFTGNIIPFNVLKMGRKIGQGGFGEVFLAEWFGTVVAVKKLLVQNISKRRINEFAKEIEHCSNFDHPNIVKHFGACVETPNLAIVMEYLDMSLFDALHIRTDMELTEANRLTVIQYTIEGTKYLHDQGIAHCDLKTANVLMNYDDENGVAVKLADFGISMVKNNTQTSVSGARDMMQYGGTPRYSAPEVLRGEMLSAADMMKADIYSLALLIFEIIYEEEPFYELTYAQLQKQVGENHLQVSIPGEPSVDDDVINIIKASWAANATQRPEIDECQYVFSTKQNLYNSF
ncbi:hypothetical protein ACF0H5_000759 [Mactra antiquata]